MTTQDTKQVPDEVKEFLQINLFTESYSRSIVHEYEYNGKNLIDFSLQPQHVIDAAAQDIAIIKERVKNYQARTGLKLGEFVRLPDGQIVIITHVWEDGQVQTSAGGSMHLSKNGYISYSGGMDSGLKASDLIPTDETETNRIWFFHKGFSGGGRGVYYNVPFKVYRTKEGADLDGIPQIEALRRKKLSEQAETITRINGNGQPYTLPVPQIKIIDHKGKYIKENCTLSGIKFESNGFANLWAQPMKVEQVENLLKDHSFKADYYNNGTYKNTLLLFPTEYDSERTKIYKP